MGVDEWMIEWVNDWMGGWMIQNKMGVSIKG
jgi:hypothetical protein